MKKSLLGMLLLALPCLAGCDDTQNEASNPDKNPMVSAEQALHAGWRLFQLGKATGVPASVPGVVQEDLMNSGGIQDPFYRMQEQDTQWVGDASWEYRLSTDVSDDVWEMDKINLVFEGLDTYADVYLNDSLILQGENMFRRYKVDVKNALKKKDNQIRVVFTPPSKFHADTWANKKYELPTGNDAGEEKVSVYTRKAAYHFGWDWSPYLVTTGIWRPVYFEGLNSSHIEVVGVEQGEISEEKSLMNLSIEVDSEHEGAGELKFFLDGSKPPLKHRTVKLKKGRNEFRIPVEITNPELWWPNGYGDQRMYSLKTELTVLGELTSSSETRFGIRTVELIQENDSIGNSFYFKVNGTPVFIKGANYIPQDNLLTRVTDEDYRRLISNAISANMNMLRVWGGGIYENDLFYELCDENGILVWQDFMFACSMYPGDKPFLNNIDQEVRQNVSRLRNHPSIALWCGNNEMDVAWHNWGWQEQYNYTAEDSAEIWNNYLKIFHDLIPNILEEMDNGRAYVTTSPLSNWGTPENFKHGSMHYWGVWHGREPFENYQTNVGRFMSEYGFQSFPEMETVRTFATDGDLDLDSDVMKHHQKSYIGNDLMMNHLTAYFPRPKTFDDFVYLSILSQAHGMEMAIGSHRLKKGHCMGTMYWQLNDCWPGPSWSSIDFEGNWKKLHYSVRDLYAPTALVVSRSARDIVSVSVVTDGQSGADMQASMKLINFNGATVKKIRGRKIDGSKDAVTAAVSMHVDEIWDEHSSPNEHVLLIELEDMSGKLVAKRYFHGTEFKKLKLRDPKIRLEVTKAEGGYQCQVTCESYASNVFLKCEGHATPLPENYFELFPGQPKTFKFNSSQEQGDFEAHLSIRSLYDTF